LIALGASQGSLLWFGGGLVLQGLGNGVAVPPLNAAVASAVPIEDVGIAAAANRLLSQVGNAFGITILTLAYGSRGGGSTVAFAVGGALSVLAVVTALAMEAGDAVDGLGSRAGGSGASRRAAASGTGDRVERSITIRMRRARLGAHQRGLPHARRRAPNRLGPAASDRLGSSPRPARPRGARAGCEPAAATVRGADHLEREALGEADLVGERDRVELLGRFGISTSSTTARPARRSVGARPSRTRPAGAAAALAAFGAPAPSPASGGGTTSSRTLMRGG
jgi:hypothetical protein